MVSGAPAIVTRARDFVTTVCALTSVVLVTRTLRHVRRLVSASIQRVRLSALWKRANHVRGSDMIDNKHFHSPLFRCLNFYDVTTFHIPSQPILFVAWAVLQNILSR